MPPAGVSAPSLVFSYDQIADQLTDGFWNHFGGGPRAFDVATGDTLYVDITGLTADGQLMAYKHNSFWQCMDTLREKQILQDFWDSGEAPWKVWS